MVPKLLLTAGLFISCHGLSTPSIPPIWQPAFSVDFQEDLYHSTIKLSHNNGSWFYDFTNGRARYDHLRGQTNNFCAGQKLSDNDPKAPCSLLFTNHSSMYVFYPEAKTCCALCGEKEGCTVLKPTWLTNATYIGNKMFEGQNCTGWSKPGIFCVDELYVTDKNVPCQYHEQSYKENYIHTLTFNQLSYKIGQPDASVFEIPDYCKDICPKPFPPETFML